MSYSTHVETPLNDIKETIILDHTALEFLLEKGMPDDLRYGIVPKIADLEFRMHKKNLPEWYDDLRIEMISCDRERTCMDMLFAVLTVSRRRYWVEGDTKLSIKDVRKLQTRDDYRYAAKKLFEMTDLDRNVIAQSLALSKNGGTLYTKNVTVLLFVKEIKRVSDGIMKIKDISACDFWD